jgi:hypothetical protein
MYAGGQGAPSPFHTHSHPRHSPSNVRTCTPLQVNVDPAQNVTVFGRTYSPTQSSNLITTVDVVYSLLFLVFVLYWRCVFGVTCRG